ncbi:hypothetical protein P170DRAFT_473517 [Aspergillus steynii IBT 23096]|uniref:Uncharacterized protein n=1 Tax=Aspergillus steynii IBT 23096 TaxID=1392250 RepID=A0A2I2GAN3_9EURO|nr:uncharacterized protein P170DRAFT_473517 [Aspergillus steynii IBT 23096]PLB49939.1 hypothetical protein P170DRAFT_473517 [Aspergillus steynii IBT 23096]
MDAKSQHKQFQCSTCHRVYSRIDHLTRHMRTHVHEKPYKCDTCSRGFTRQDLLQRHLRAHRTTDGSEDALQAHRGRAMRACEACAAAKVRCDDVRPCGRCRRRRIPCEHSEGQAFTENPSMQLGNPSTGGVQVPNLQPDLIEDPGVADLPRGNNTNDFSLPIRPNLHNILDFSSNAYLPTFDEDGQSVPDLLGQTETLIEHRHIAHQDDKNSYDLLSPDQRQRVLSFLCSISGPDQASSIRRTFPPTEVLNTLIQRFFYNQQTSECAFVHGPTIYSTIHNPILLASIIADGATTTNAKPLQSLGSAMQAVISSETHRLIGEFPSHIQELQLLQSHLCMLELGFWSGSRHKKETAERMARSLYDVIRSAGIFRRSYGTPLAVEHWDTGSVLHTKWLQWIQQESLRRLAYRAFVFDAQASFSTLVNPSIRYSEMCTPLPCSADLWSALTAEEWKQRYLTISSYTPLRPLSAADLLRDPTALLESRRVYDMRLSLLVVLFSALAMVWETLQLLAQTSIRPDYSHLSLAVRHQEIRQLLSHVSDMITVLELSSCPVLVIMLNLVKMHLHIRIEEVQEFAAGDSPAETCCVLPLLRQWVLNPTSRQALWSAGQILRAARDFQPGTLRDFYAIAVYHTAVCFWAYTVISNSLPSVLEGHGLSSDNAFDLVSRRKDVPMFLDGLFIETTQAFLDHDQCQPGITTATESGMFTAGFVPISNAPATMKAVSDTLRRNHLSQTQDATLPLMVQNIISLMYVLGSSSSV